MGVSYDVTNKEWSFTEDPLLARKTVNYPKKRYMNVKYKRARVDRNRYEPWNIEASISTTAGPNKEGLETTQESRWGDVVDYMVYISFEIPLERGNSSSYRARLNGHLENNLGKEIAYSEAVQNTADNFDSEQPGIEKQQSTAQNNAKINQEIIDPYNEGVTKANAALPKVEKIINATKGDDYVTQRDFLREYKIAGLEDNFKTFYLNEKLETWDSKLGAKPPYGTFDPSYYGEQNPDVAAAYEEAVKNDDVDIVNRYGKNNYYLWHYSTQGKDAGARGNAAEVTERANKYLETKPTDVDLQNVRTLQLGIGDDYETSQDERLLRIPAIAEQFEKAQRDDPYWSQLGKDNYLDPTKPDEFVALFRLSERPEDKVIALNYNINLGYGVSELEDAISEAVGTKATVDTKKFGALAQDVLRETIEEMKQAKAKEEMLDLLSGFGGFSEIVNINQTLTNSILGDTGVGGILSFTSAGKAEESLENSLQGITGVKNNTTYNWQQWFDNELKQRYQDDLELGFTTGEAEDKIKIEGEFARQFIDDYLIPRFDTSRSMDEFVEYIDIRQEEQSPFTTQSLYDAVNLVADLKREEILQKIRGEEDRSFDSAFYFNPTGNHAREPDYLKQAETVQSDWEKAKNGDPYWATQAYRFGVDVNDKDAFARMHFEVKGQGQGYDAADDILNPGKIQDEIYDNILPALKEEALKNQTVFGQFVTPEEFADEVLQGLDPGDKTAWEETLQRYGLTDFKGTVDELKEYIVETLRTGSAQDIREQIKYLNEKRQRPTQKKLGITYIERPEDYKDELAKAETEMYKIFQDAGFQGTEDEFYDDFFPDVDRSEQILLTKAGSDKGLEMYNLDLSDPFASLGTIEGFFEEDTTLQDKSDKSDESSFFSLGLSDDDDDYKSKTGETILGEFTSMFKGL